MKKSNWVKRILAIVLAVVLVASGLPDMGRPATVSAATYSTGNTNGVVATIDDPETLTRPADTYGEVVDGVFHQSTLNAGKILVGKSVTDGRNDADNSIEALDLSGEAANAVWTPEAGNFLVTVSQSAQMYGVTNKISVPMDVVFVIDTSGSMNTDTDPAWDVTKTRASVVVEAANAAISAILGMNDQNRVAVVGFSTGASTLTQLGHYNDDDTRNNMAASQHITWNYNNSAIRGRNADGSVKTSGRNATNGGTNIHAGIVMGAKILAEQQNTTVSVDTDGDGINDQTMSRMPILIVLSDGAATYSMEDVNWWDPEGDEQGPGSGAYAGNGFLAALSASYYKNLITTNYYGANSQKSALIYTIGIGLTEETNDSDSTKQEKAFARVTMDPTNNLDLTTNSFAETFRDYWEEYQTEGTKTNGTFEIEISGYSDYTFYNDYEGEEWQENPYGPGGSWVDVSYDNIDLSVTSLKYNDKYFAATSTDEIVGAFNELVTEIQKRAITYPTLVDTTLGQNFSGYVTFTDPIGQYMEVKKVHGVVGDGALYQGIGMAGMAENYDPQWETNETDEDQRAFNAALEQNLLDRIRFSNASSDADPSLAQVRAILDVVTMTETERSVSYYDGNSQRTFDYGTYGGQLYYNSASDYGNSFTWFGKLHYLEEGVTASTAKYNDEYSIGFIGIAPKNADSVEKWLKAAESGDATVENSPAKLLAQAKAAGANCIVRSYFMYGKDGEMLHFQLRVITSLSEPHQQYVSIKAPASLLALQTVLIDETDPANPVAHYDELTPTRVTYEVGLRSDINENNVYDIVDENYLKTYGNVDADGKINFYTNDFKRYANENAMLHPATGVAHDHAYANVTFDVSAENSFYRYEEDTQLFLSPDDNAPATGTTLADGTYYYKKAYYRWVPNASGESEAKKVTEWVAIQLTDGWENTGKIVRKDDGNWYVLKGTYTAFTLTDGDDLMKDDPNTAAENDGNETGTAHIVSHPQRTESENDSHYTVWLGNNGKLTYAGIKTKDVIGDDVTSPAKETDVKIDGKPVMVGDVLTYILRAENTEDEAATIVFTDVIPADTEYVADSVTVTVNGTTVSNPVFIVNGRNLEVTVADVPVDHIAEVRFQVKVLNRALGTMVNNQAQIEVDNNTFDTNITSNPAVGKKVNSQTGAEIPEAGATVGEYLQYQIAYFNDAGVLANVTIQDIVPEGTTFVDASHMAYLKGYDAKTGGSEVPLDPKATDYDATKIKRLEWNLPAIESGNGGVVTFGVRVNAAVKDNTGTTDGNQPNIINVAKIIFNNDPNLTYETNETITKVKTGNLELEKTVVPAPSVGDSHANDTFTLKLTESTKLLEGTYNITITSGSTSTPGTVVFAGGEATVQIKHGEKITIQNLPANVIITVEETVYGTGYTPTISGGGVVTVLPSLDAQGQAQEPAKVDVNNAYKPLPATLVIKGTKQFNNYEPTAQTRTFYFTLQESSNTGVVSSARATDLVSNVTITTGAAGTSFASNSGDFTFASMSYEAVGTYYYRLEEVTENVSGMLYDDRAYLITVVVKDNDGQLYVDSVAWAEIGSSTTNGTATLSSGTASVGTRFVNTALHESLNLVGKKILENAVLRENQFAFIVDEVITTASGTEYVRAATGQNAADGTINFTTLNYHEAGTHIYRVTEAGVSSSSMDYSSAVHYVKVEVALQDSKLVKTVSYGTSASGAWTPLNANQYSAKDTSVLSFTNTYKPSTYTVHLAGNKTLNGRDMTAGEFSFAVVKDAIKVDAGTNAAATNGQNGAITFAGLSYTLEQLGDDKTEVFTYTIKEEHGTNPNITYDTTEYTAKVTVTYDDAAGWSHSIMYEKNGSALANGEVPVFVNTYAPDPVHATPGVIKKVITSGGDIPTDLTFAFVAKKAAEALAPDGKTPIEDGYEIGDEVGYGVSNAFTASDVTGDATKTVSVGVTFGQFDFYKAGTYWAWLMEALPADDDPSTPEVTSHGVTYDTARYLMKIVVTQASNSGVLSINETDGITYYRLDNNAEDKFDNYNTVISAADLVTTGLSFNNEYAADGKLVISAKKELKGRALNANEFGFTLVNEDGTPHVGVVDAEGNIVFDTLLFTEDDVEDSPIIYTMNEVPGRLPGVLYDQTEYVVTVTLTDDGEGNITATPSFSKNGISVDADAVKFVNIYYPQASYTVNITKTLVGRDMQAGEFIFEMTDDDGNVESSALVGSAKAGEKATVSLNVTFPVLPGQTPLGTHEFYITEQKGTLPGVDYDSTKYLVEITVADADKNGELEFSHVVYIVTDSGKTLFVDENNKPIPAFVNEYAPESVEINLIGYKTLVDTSQGNQAMSLQPGQFDFEISQTHGPGTTDPFALEALAQEVVRAIGTNDASGNITFTTIELEEEGAYQFKVSEDVTGNVTGVTHDLRTYTVTVVVRDNTTTGKLEATVTFDGVDGTNVYDATKTGAGAQIQFRNTYDPVDETFDFPGANIDVTKTLIGRSMNVGEFTFHAKLTGYKADANATETTTFPAGAVTEFVGSNLAPFSGQSSAEIDFMPIVYKTKGYYIYTITEADVSAPKVTKDQSEYKLVIYVKDEGGKLVVPANGGVTITKTKNADGTEIANGGTSVDEITFTNRYTPDPIKVYVQALKNLTGKALLDQEFTFDVKDSNGIKVAEGHNLANGMIVFDYDLTQAGIQNTGLTISEGGIYYYTITEASGNVEEMTYDTTPRNVKVDVSDEGLGTLTATVSYDNPETPAEDYTATTPTFKNVYDPEDIPIKIEDVMRPLNLGGAKELIGRDMRDGEFLFQVKDVNGVPVANGRNKADGSIVYDYNIDKQDPVETGIMISQAGRYYFSIEEIADENNDQKNDLASMTYDPAIWYVRFDVIQKDTGELVLDPANPPMVVFVRNSTADIGNGVYFTNTYDPADAHVNLVGYKNLNSLNDVRTLKEKDFEFHILYNGSVVSRGYNDANGVITFEPLNLTRVTTAPLNLVIKEVNQGLDGVTYDATEIPVLIKVIDNPTEGRLEATVEIDVAGNGNYVVYDATKVGTDAQIQFTNDYKGLPTSTRVHAEKVLNGRPLVDGEFQFTLTPDDQNPDLQDNDTANDVVITGGLNNADGAVTFEVRNLSEVGIYKFTMAEFKGDKQTITYSDKTYEVTIEVTDPGTGRLHAVVSYEQNKVPEFTNTYEPLPGSADIVVTKKLTGRDMFAGEFEFVINDANGMIVAKGENNVDGQVVFDRDIILPVGTHELSISELTGTAEYVTYDTTTYKVTVVVVDDNGQLKATVTYPEGGVVFKNTYEKPAPQPQPQPQPEPPAPPAANPDTGDTANMGLWISLMGISLLAAVAAVVVSKRKRRIGE